MYRNINQAKQFQRSPSSLDSIYRPKSCQFGVKITGGPRIVSVLQTETRIILHKHIYRFSKTIIEVHIIATPHCITQTFKSVCQMSYLRCFAAIFGIVSCAVILFTVDNETVLERVADLGFCAMSPLAPIGGGKTNSNPEFPTQIFRRAKIPRVVGDSLVSPACVAQTKSPRGGMEHTNLSGLYNVSL